MDKPIVSAIIPVYNKRAFVKNCIESIITWGKCGFEVIIVDDGSTDGSGEVIDAFSKVPNVTIIHQKNCGVSAARNVGLKIAKGEYITFVDADDELIPGSLDDVLPYLNGIDDICIAGAITEGEQKPPIFKDTVFEGENADAALNFILTGGTEERRIPKSATKFMAGCKEKFYRRAFIDGNGLKFDEKLIRNEDVFWSCCCYYFAKRIHFLPVNVYIMKIDPNGITKGTDIHKTVNSFIAFLDKFEDFFKYKLSEQVLGCFYFHQSIIVNYEAYRSLKLKQINRKEFRRIMNEWCALDANAFMLMTYKGLGLSFFKRITYYMMKMHCYLLIGIEMDTHHRYR